MVCIFHGYVFYVDFCILNFMDPFLVKNFYFLTDFCARQHGNEGSLYLLADGPLYQYQLSFSAAAKGS